MECNKLGKRFLKIKVKVTGFLIAKIEKRNTSEQVIIAKRRNTILTTGLQNLLNAFQTYMSGVNYLGVNAPSIGIVITTSSGTKVTLSFLNPPAISTENNSVILSFTVRDTTASSYTATSEELITASAGYNIPIATANLSITKNSDEILTMTWIITISVSPSGNITYIPTLTPQEAGANCSYCGGGCSFCNQTSANSEYAYGCSSSCQLYGLTSQYPQSNFVTSALFSDIFYNTYSKGSSTSLTYASGTTLIIYTLYCLEYFVVGLWSNNPMFSNFNSGGGGCFTPGTPDIVTTAYLQVYSPSQTASYIGVQIEFTT